MTVDPNNYLTKAYENRPYNYICSVSLQPEVAYIMTSIGKLDIWGEATAFVQISETRDALSTETDEGKLALLELLGQRVLGIQFVTEDDSSYYKIVIENDAAIIVEEVPYGGLEDVAALF